MNIEKKINVLEHINAELEKENMSLKQENILLTDEINYLKNFIVDLEESKNQFQISISAAKKAKEEYEKALKELKQSFIKLKIESNLILFGSKIKNKLMQKGN